MVGVSIARLRVGTVEAAFELLYDEHVEASDDYNGGYAEDENEVEEGAQPPQEASERALLQCLRAGFEEVIHGPPAVVYLIGHRSESGPAYAW